MQVHWNPMSEEYLADPAPQLHQLRSFAPVHWSDLAQAWLLTRYDHCEEVLRAPDRFRATPAHRLGFLPRDEHADGPLDVATRKWIPLLDKPDHTRLRQLLNKGFAPRQIREMRPAVQNAVDTLIDALRKSDAPDLVRDFTMPLPMLVMAGQLGVPAEDYLIFKEWSDKIAMAMDPMVGLNHRYKGDRAVQEMRDYLEDLVEDRRAEPQDDILSRLVTAEEEGDRLSEEELYSSLVLLLFAGNDTTTNFLTNSAHALLERPDQAALLVRRPDIVDRAIEELARYTTPTQGLSRLVVDDTTIGGWGMMRDQRVIIMIAAANRDPAVFEKPDDLDLTRDPNPHFAFGIGTHFCLGVHLARLEGQIGLPALFEALPEVELLGGRPELRDGFALRGYKSLPVRFRRTAKKEESACIQTN